MLIDITTKGHSIKLYKISNQTQRLLTLHFHFKLQTDTHTHTTIIAQMNDNAVHVFSLYCIK